MKIKMTIVMATLMLLAAFTAGNVNAQTAALTAPTGTSAANGSERGQVIVSWDAVEDAAFYRIGWVALPDYDTTVAAGRDWLEAFHFLDAANTGQTQWTLTRLSPGVEYYFIVASNDNRNGVPQYSAWSNLLTLTPAPPVDYSGQYPNCDAVREHHPGGVKRGSPIYRTSLDPDGDGFACDTATVPVSGRDGSKRTSPIPYGQRFQAGVFDMQITTVDTDAWPEIRAENQFNDPPPQGKRFVMWTLQVWNVRGSHDEGESITEGDFELTGNQGVTHLPFSEGVSCGVTPNDLRHELYRGGTVTGTTCFAVPISEIGAGLTLRYDERQDTDTETGYVSVWFDALPD